MSRQWLVVLGIVAAIVGGTIVAVRFGPSHIEVGVIAPDFEATNLADGAKVSLHAGYKGQVTLVNIWATWCEPCKKEIPALDSLYRALAPEGFRLVAVSVDTDPPEKVKAFMDGSLGSGTAWLLDGSGVVITTGEELAEIVRGAAAAGWPVAVHAIGDRANREALDAFEATREAWSALAVIDAEAPRSDACAMFLPNVEPFCVSSIVASAARADARATSTSASACASLAFAGASSSSTSKAPASTDWSSLK